MEGYIDLKNLTFDELAGVVNLYPWFGNARKELCLRLAEMGDAGMVSSAVAEAALYVPSRRKLAGIVREKQSRDCTDKDMDALLRTYISGEGKPADNGGSSDGRQVYVVGGDYFSQAQYDGIRNSEDNVFQDFARQASAERKNDDHEPEDMPGFYTETLARIYAEQGYPEQARKIYSQLILAYPEKNAYFAALIRKLEQEN